MISLIVFVVILVIAVVAAISQAIFPGHGQNAAQDAAVVLGQQLHGQTPGLPGGGMVFDYQHHPIGVGRKRPAIGKADNGR